MSSAPSGEAMTKSSSKVIKSGAVPRVTSAGKRTRGKPAGPSLKVVEGRCHAPRERTERLWGLRTFDFGTSQLYVDT